MIASSLSKTQAILILHSFIATFTGSNITKYSGLNTVAIYMNRQHLVKSISTFLPTVWHNATKFGVNQVLMAITLASISGINRIYRIAVFSGDGLLKALLKLDKAINENAISATLKNLGLSGARKLQILLLLKNARWLRESGLASITLDADSTVKSVCGNQEGAEKGFNTTKKGAKIYENEYSRRGVKPNWPQLNSLCSYTRLILVQKIQFG